MTDEECEELRKVNEHDEWKYQDFCVSGVLALIGASWVLKEEATNKGQDYKLLLWAIFIGIIFLAIRGIRQFLNIRHNRKILNNEADADEKDLPSPHPTDAPCETRWGQISQWLFPLEVILLLLAVSFFLTNSFIILIP